MATNDKVKEIQNALLNKELHVSHSQIIKFANCPLAWRYYMVDRLRLKRITSAVGKRTLGNLIHMGLEHFIRTTEGEDLGELNEFYYAWLGDHIDQLDDGIMPEELNLLEDLIYQAGHIVPKVIKEIKREIGYGTEDSEWITCYDKNDEPMIEYEVVGYLPNGVKILGYVDWVLYNTRLHKTLIVDFKSTSTKKTSYDSDVQASGIYNVLLQQLGITASHSDAMVIEINAKELKKPNLNKDGSMSRAQLHTTWEIYRDELVRNELDPNDYVDVRRKLMKNKFVSTHRVLRTEIETKNIWNNRCDIVDSILYALDVNKFPANLGSISCNGCDYKEACMEDLAGFGYMPLVDAGVYEIKQDEQEVGSDGSEEPTNQG